MKNSNSGPFDREFSNSSFPVGEEKNEKDFREKKVSSTFPMLSNWFGFPFSTSFFSIQRPVPEKMDRNQTARVSNFNSNQTQVSRSFPTTKANTFFGPKEEGSEDKRLNPRVKGRGRGEKEQQQVVSITYEEIGLFPRSFNRVFDRFFKQLFFDVENLVIQEYRFYRYLFLTTVKCLFILIAVPLFVNFISKNYLIRPITEYYWNLKQPEIFLNSFQQKRAFNELKSFEEKIYFESLIQKNPKTVNFQSSFSSSNTEKNEQNNEVHLTFKNSAHALESQSFSQTSLESQKVLSVQKVKAEKTDELPISSHEDEIVLNFQENLNFIQKKLQAKTLELAIHYNEESIESITNFFADLLSFITLCFLLFNLEIQINITKSFLLEVFFGLDDSKKSLLILFVTDLLVGYHSPNIWELFFSSFFEHYGLPENETTIFLLVATLPVLLDVLFKYLIFRHLNRASPATVATYHAMIE